MPGKVKVKILAGKNLPVMDRSRDTTDAYVEIKLGGTTYKTDVCKKSLNPQWNTDWYRFEVDDLELQDEPLQIRLMDYDTYSANDSIGKVYLNLNPLLLPSGSLLPRFGLTGDSSNSGEHVTNSVMSGWLPVYDTMHGIRGEVNVIVKVELFSDFNRFRQSSCGVHFFCSSVVPHGYYVQMINGFVEELIVNNDPEYQWIDKIRTPRASNEARQTLFFKLSCELQRKVGVKTIELGGNAVIGYSQCFDLERECGVVVRGTGTAVTLIKLKHQPTINPLDSNEEQTLKYLKFLRYNKGFYLNRNATEYMTRSTPTSFIINSNYNSNNNLMEANRISKSTISLNCPLISKEATSLQNLLKQEDMRGNSSSLSQKIRNLKYSSQTILSKRMTALKSKLSDDALDNDAIKSSLSSNTLTQKLKKSNPMAEILIHSLMRTSLDCIIETHDGSSASSVSPMPELMHSKSSRSSSESRSAISDNLENKTSSSNSISSSTDKILKSDEDEFCNTFKDIENEQFPPLAEFDDFNIEDSPANFIIGDESFSEFQRNDHRKHIFETSFVNDVGYSPKSLCHDTDLAGYDNKSDCNENPVHVKVSALMPSSESIIFSNDPSYSNTMSSNLPVDVELNYGSNNLHASLANSLRNASSPVSETIRHGHGHQRTESVGAKGLHSPARFHPIPYMHRRSSDSDLSITPKGNSLTGSDKSCGLPSGYFSRLGPLLKSIGPQENFEMLEYPFLTISSFPPGLVIYLGGVVSARSVKLLGRATSHEEPESRDIWWTEIRMEIRSHARSLGCNAVIGYSESSSICDEVCILSASGTAAVVGIQYTGEISDGISGIPFISKPYYNNKEATTSLDRSDFDKDKTSQKLDHTLFTSTNVTTKPLSESPENEIPNPYTSTPSACTLCHVGYVAGSVPLRTVTSKCRVCRLGKVPDVLLATVEMPDGMPTVGRGCFVQAYVCRPLKDSRGESYAKDLSDVLPFVEYELHRKLLNKLKIQGMNAVFGLRVRITIGAKTLIGIVTGTGVFLLALPPPPLPKLVSDSPTDERKLAEMQKLLFDTVKLNKEIYQLKLNDDIQGIQTSPDEVFEDDHPQLNLFFDNRECCVLEVDDLEDMEVRNLITESRPPDGFHVVNTESVPGLDELEIVKNLQMFTQIWRAKLQHPFNLGIHVQKLLQSVYFKLRRMIPCALCNLKFRIDLPESDEIQLSVLGMALELGVPDKSKPKQKYVLKDLKKSEDDMIFSLEDDHVESSTSQSNSGHLSVQTAKCRGRSPQRLPAINFKKVLHRERHGVDITPLSFIPGGKIERYLGNLNFFFIRETTSLREEGGLSGFIHSFIMEVLAIIRAHMVALGGNAMVAYYMTECVLSHSLHRNQGQCLINVGGDVVFVSYFSEE